MTNKKLVVANWKSNGNLQENQLILQELAKQDLATQVVICPPSVYLQQVKSLIDNTQIILGAQDVSPFANGAFTGDVSATMLADVGAEFVLLGHSERRQLHKEDNSTIKQKLNGAYKAKLKPILCVGETLAQREANATFTVILQDLDAIVKDLTLAELSELTIAYEPVWAIGTGKTATEAIANEVHTFIREYLQKIDVKIASKIKILYGGSLNEKNFAAMFKMPNIDGGLVGGASLDAQKFIEICSFR